MIDWKKEGERKGGELFPDGVYKVAITNWEYTTASTGTQQVRVKAEVIEPGEYKNKSIVDHFALTDTAQWKIARLVTSIIDKDTLPNMEPNSLAFNNVLDTIRGKTVYWTNQQRVYNGAKKNEIVDWKPTRELLQYQDVNTDVPDFLKEE